MNEVPEDRPQETADQVAKVVVPDLMPEEMVGHAQVGEVRHEGYPFWGYSDLLLFLMLTVPCMFVGALLGLGVAKGAVALFHLHGKIPALDPLAEQFGGYAVLFSCLALILRFQYNRPFWASLEWVDPVLPYGWIAIFGLMCAIGVALLGALIHTPTTDNPMTELLKDRTSAILMTIFGVTIAPLTEELAFRGFLQPLLVRSLGALPGILLATVPFGLLHYKEYGNSWRHVVLIGLAGSAFGVMRHVTKSTKASAIMHASYNALIFTALFSNK